jgi:hypothetical protein
VNSGRPRLRIDAMQDAQVNSPKDLPSMPMAVSAKPSSATAASFESSTSSSLGPVFWRS